MDGNEECARKVCLCACLSMCVCLAVVGDEAWLGWAGEEEVEGK